MNPPMERPFTYQDLLGLQEVKKIGNDILLLPEQEGYMQEEAHALLNAGIIDRKESVIVDAMMKVIQLYEEYATIRLTTDAEPEWINTVPVSVRTQLRLDYAQREEDPLAIMPSFLSSKVAADEFDAQPTFAAGFSYLILDYGLCDDTDRAFELGRLKHIKQLGFLNSPPYNDYIVLQQSLSDGSRYLHSLDVYVIATAIGHNLGLGKRRMNTLGVLALTHDVRTPAGGDSVKLIDLENLDEDKTYHLTLEAMGEKFDQLQKKYGIDCEELLEGIHNRGLIGEILDVADKLAYIARDIAMCLNHIQVGTRYDQYGLKTLLSILRHHPYVCSVWDCVKVSKDGQLYFADTRRLIAFLKVRVLMFRELYYNPVTRFGEFFMSRLFVKMLYDKGELTRDTLLAMTDHELLAFIDRRFGNEGVLERCSRDVARVESFPTPETAEEFVRKLKAEGKRFTMIDDDRRMIKTGTRFKVKTKDGIKTLEEADPGSARELHEMATMLPLVHVYYLESDPHLPKNVLDELVEYMSKQPVRGD